MKQKTRAIAMSVHFMKVGSSVPRCDCWTAAVRECLVVPAISMLESTRPLLEEVYSPQQQKRKNEQHHCQCYGALVIVFLQTHHNQVGRYFRTKWLVAGDEND